MNLKSKKLLIICLIAGLAISMLSGISAADITINSKTPGGLKKAVTNAKDGDTIILKNGVYKGASNMNIQINKNINIKGQSTRVVLDGQGRSQILIVNMNTVTVEKITFTNGKGNVKSGSENYGGAIKSSGKLTVKNCIFTKNKSYKGGAIYTTYIDPKPKSYVLTVENSKFTDNIAEYEGGAISTTYIDLTLRKCSFTNNQANSYGGAIKIGINAKMNSIDSTFINNIAGFHGGAINAHNDLTVSNCTFTNNKAEKYFGGAINAFKKLSIVNSNFNNNIAGKDCGAIGLSRTSSGSIVNSKFTKNIAKGVYDAIDRTFGYKVSLKNNQITPKDGTEVK